MRINRCLLGILSLLFAGSLMAGSMPIDWEAESQDQWHGFKRYRMRIDGCAAWVVAPKKVAPGRPWIWGMEFPQAFDTRTGAIPLVQAGYHYLHISVGNTYGAPVPQKHFDAFYKWFVKKGLNPKGTLIGLSRGGLYIYNFATRHPERVVCLYGDAPVCDPKSWPGGKGAGKGSPSDWKRLIRLYGFKNEAEAMGFQRYPIHTPILLPLARAGIPLIHVVGDKDHVVPQEENSAIVEANYKKLGGVITVFHKPKFDHHPHGLDDPSPVVALIKRYTDERMKK